MERSMKMKMIVGVLMMWMVVGEASITCGQVSSLLAPCITYLKGETSGIPAACCNGIKSLNSKASTTADRRDACTCMKNAATSISGLNYGAASKLPQNCNVNIRYSISPSTDCNKVA